MRNFNDVVVKEGYEMMLFMQTKSGNYYLAIIHRIAADDYVFCTGYDITDGTWGQGHYCDTYASAYRAFVDYIG